MNTPSIPGFGAEASLDNGTAQLQTLTLGAIRNRQPTVSPQQTDACDLIWDCCTLDGDPDCCYIYYVYCGVLV